MGKILIAGQNKQWGTLEQATKFWLKLGIKHVMINKEKDTMFIENGRVVEQQFKKFQELQEEHGVKYHLHSYYTKVDGRAISISLAEHHSRLIEFFTELDEKIDQYNLYPLIIVHPPVFENPKYNIKVDKAVALENGIEFFTRLSSMNLKSKIALETMPNPFKNLNYPNIAILGYKADHFQKMIWDKNYGLCIDIGHLNLAKELLEKFLEFPIFSVHLHGNDRIRDEHKMATKDNVKNFEGTKKMLKNVKGPVTLEVRGIYNYSANDFDRLFELWELR